MRRRRARSTLGSQDRTPFILVTGPMRSGTTLVGELLYSRAYREPRHPHLAFDNNEGVTVAAVGPANASSAKAIREEILSLAPATAPAALGAKVTDRTLENLVALEALFPHLTVVICVRDPVAIYRSHRKRRDLSAAMALRICRGIAANEALIDARPGAIVLNHEDFVRAPEPVITRILQSAGLDPAAYDWASLRNGRVASNSSFAAGASGGFVLDYGLRSTQPEEPISGLERTIIEATCETAFRRLHLPLVSTRQEREALRGLLGEP